MQVVQGIKELTSRYAQLIALKGNPTLSWDMRVATSSLDSATLNTIFKRRIDQTDLNARLAIEGLGTHLRQLANSGQRMHFVHILPRQIQLTEGNVTLGADIEQVNALHRIK